MLQAKTFFSKPSSSLHGSMAENLSISIDQNWVTITVTIYSDSQKYWLHLIFSFELETRT